MSKTVRKIVFNFLAVSVALAGLVFLTALITGNGNAALPAAESVANDSCAQISEDADALAVEAGTMPQLHDGTYDTTEVLLGTTIETLDHRAYETDTSAWRQKMTAMLHVIASNPNCFPARQVAEAQSYLDRIP